MIIAEPTEEPQVCPECGGEMFDTGFCSVCSWPDVPVYDEEGNYIGTAEQIINDESNK